MYVSFNCMYVYEDVPEIDDQRESPTMCYFSLLVARAAERNDRTRVNSSSLSSGLFCLYM